MEAGPESQWQSGVVDRVSPPRPQLTEEEAEATVVWMVHQRLTSGQRPSHALTHSPFSEKRIGVILRCTVFLRLHS